MPERIQRKRVKGWRMPLGAVYVGRGADWGNPFRVDLLLLLNIALSDLIERAAGQRAPIDFQIQSVTEANVPGHGVRNPMGFRHEGESWAREPRAADTAAGAPNQEGGS